MRKPTEKNRSNITNAWRVCVAATEQKLSRIVPIDLLGDELNSDKLGEWGSKLKLSSHEKAMLLWPIQLTH